MSVRPLVILPDAQLRLVSKPVEAVTPEIRTLVADMFETMYDAPGIGLAAIQIGVPLRVVTIDLSKLGPQTVNSGNLVLDLGNNAAIENVNGGNAADVITGNAGDDTISGVEAAGPQEMDFINGGEGNDILILGASDHATGGAGNDAFVLQEWLNEASVTHIADYDPAADRLVIIYDQAVHPDPVLTVEPNDGGSGRSIFIDGAKIAVVNGGPFSADDVRLVAA